MSQSLSSILTSIPVCAWAGAIAGVIAGSQFALVEFAIPHVRFSASDLFRLAVLFGLAAWVVLLVITGLWLRYGVRAVVLQSLVNAILTSIIVVFIDNAVNIPALSGILGFFIGMALGAFLCRYCGRIIKGSP
jgi:hypothetical protein